MEKEGYKRGGGAYFKNQDQGYKKIIFNFLCFSGFCLKCLLETLKTGQGRKFFNYQTH